MDLFTLIIISVIVGIVVGMLSGLLGIGGGTILVTVFKLAYGLPALASTATSMFTIIPTSLSGAATHIKNKTCIPRFGIAAGLGGALTSPVGVWLATLSPEWLVMVAAAIIIGYSALTMIVKAVQLWKKQSRKSVGHDGNVNGNASRETSVQVTSSPDQHAGAKPVMISAAIGLVAGVLSGYVGLGGGFLMVPMMMQLLHLPMRQISGTSLIGVLILAIPGTITQAMLGNVDWTVGLSVSLGAIPGAYFGSKLMPKVPEIALRFGFGIFLFIAASLLAIEQIM